MPVPDTRMSTPASAARCALSILMPPSISISHARPRASIGGARGAHLVEDLGNERLTAEPGLHAHHEQQVELVEIRLDRCEGGLGLERETGLHAEIADLVEQAGAGRRARCARCSRRHRRRRTSSATVAGCRPSGGSRGRGPCRVATTSRPAARSTGSARSDRPCSRRAADPPPVRRAPRRRPGARSRRRGSRVQSSHPEASDHLSNRFTMFRPQGFEEVTSAPVHHRA